MQADKNYWKSLFLPPYCPDQSDVEFIRRNKLGGSTLLLGCTRILIPVSDYQMDIDPWYEADTVIQENWRNNKVFFNNIIADGALNLSEELTHDVLRMAFNCCNKFIVRYFNYKLPDMRIANCFKDPNDMEFIPNVIIKHEHYSFLMWNFNEKNWF